jgi:hypothetical protein
VEPAVTRRPRSRSAATALASLGFVILIVGITYFAMLVLAVHYGEQDERAAAYRELGFFLSGGHGWHRDARVYGAAALLCALVSLLFGLSPLARITIPIAGACYVALIFRGEEIGDLIFRWAKSGG